MPVNSEGIAFAMIGTRQPPAYTSYRKISNGTRTRESGDVLYRRIAQDPEDQDEDRRSSKDSSSESVSTMDPVPDEYNTLMDETHRKNGRLYGEGDLERSSSSGSLRGGRSRNKTGGSSWCGFSRKKRLLWIIFGFGVFILVLYSQLGNEKGRSVVGTISGWSANTSRLTANYVRPDENTTLIEPLNICNGGEERRGDDTPESEKILLLIVVCSSAANFEARQVIRETWGNVSEFNYPAFVRLHAHLKGEYLGPLPGRQWNEFILKASPGSNNDAEQQEGVTIENTRSTIKSDNDQSKNSSNKSSHNFSEAPEKWLMAQNLNVKVVFLVGQTEADYRRESTEEAVRSAGHDEASTVLAVVAAPAVEPTQSLPRAPSLALVPNGGDASFIDAANEIGVSVDRQLQQQQEDLQARLANESDVYGDIIQESFIDSYNNLTLKTVMMLKWVTNNCNGRVKYIMKCDDDTFVNVPNLVHVLLGGTVPLYKASVTFYDRNTVDVKSKKNRLARPKHLLMGLLFCGVRPITDISSKWYSPNYMYSKEFYPKYLSGTAYLMNMEAAKLLYRTALKTPIFHLEDVYLTGIVADRAKLTRLHHPLFFYSRTKDLCALRGMISQHQMPPGDLRAAYDFVGNGSITCTGPPLKSLVKLKLEVRKKC